VTVEIVAPHIGGVEIEGGAWIVPDEKLDGAPSVLYDAVALLISDRGAAQLTGAAVARDFIADAYAHCKFIAYSSGAASLVEDVLGSDALDDGVIQLDGDEAAADFLVACGALRVWAREPALQIAAK
jgi:catalase